MTQVVTCLFSPIFVPVNRLKGSDSPGLAKPWQRNPGIIAGDPEHFLESSLFDLGNPRSGTPEPQSNSYLRVPFDDESLCNSAVRQVLARLS